MLLSQADAALFFRLMLGLQFYVSQQRQLAPNINSREEYKTLPSAEKLAVRNALWENPELIDAYIRENPDGLAPEELSIVSKWKGFIQGKFYIEDLKSQIKETSASIDQLEREKRRWNDEAFVRAQARERFGYVMLGETSYVVLDENGEPIESRARLNDAEELLAEPPTAWWDDAWESVELAGDPPRDEPPPANDLDAPKS